MSRAPCLRNASMSAGTSVLWPAASVDTPTACTSFSIACRAASSGVWNSGPMSTSKPRSANAVATTLAPRSWPSWPSLATMMRGRRPSSRGERVDVGLAASPTCASSANCAPYTPDTLCVVARWRPHTVSSASEISPTVARARTARIASSSRLPWPDARRLRQRRECRGHGRRCRRGLRDLRQAPESALRAPRCCRSRAPRSGLRRPSRNLLTPTITSWPLSMRACFSAAAASILSFAQPDSTARVMPPIASTSSRIAHAASAMSCVSRSIM